MITEPDAVAAVIEEHRVSKVRTVTLQCRCGVHVMTMKEHADHVAAAIWRGITQ